MKKIHIIYGAIVGVLAAVIVVGIIYLNTNYKTNIAEKKAEYEAVKAEYNEALTRILAEEKEWEEELVKTHNESNSMAAELSAIYKDRQAEKDAEEKRWNALSEEEKQAEKICDSYNEMVSSLRANNDEYAKLYVQYAAYLNQDIFNLDKTKLLDYTNLYNRKIEIEKQYMEAHPF